MKKEMVVIKQDEEVPVERGVLAQEILAISTAVKKLLKSGVNREAVIVLLSHSCKVKKSGRYNSATNVSIGTIRAVLNSLAELERQFC